MQNVNHYPGLSDSARIENALANLDEDRILLIPPRVSADEPERRHWLLDRAILLRDNTTVILQNCKLKLSDRARDNFFRSANCGLGIADPTPIQNIHIRGEGLVILEGADHPRATGDGSKILADPCPKTDADLIRLAPWVSQENRSSGQLSFDDTHSHTFGTDAHAPSESHYGDWRNIGILFANATRFSIENLRMVDYHGWGVSLEACAYGRLSRLDFDARMAKEIRGMLQNMENQDGIDLRNGCHDIQISEITGGTGDDLIALTAIADQDSYHPGGSLCTAHVMHNDWSRRERDIYNISIRQVSGYSKGHVCWLIRLLPAEATIHHVVISDVVDTSPDGFHAGGVLLLGEGDGAYGKNLPYSMHHIAISNVVCGTHNHAAILIPGYLADSSITGVVASDPEKPLIHVERESGLVNVSLAGLNTPGSPIVG